jgi:hypothetical protein
VLERPPDVLEDLHGMDVSRGGGRSSGPVFRNDLWRTAE